MHGVSVRAQKSMRMRDALIDQLAVALWGPVGEILGDHLPVVYMLVVMLMRQPGVTTGYKP